MNCEYFGCRCGAHEHYMHVWFNNDINDDSPEIIAIAMGHQWTPLRWRLKQAWNILRGNPAYNTEVLFDLDEVKRFQHALNQHIQAADQKTVP